MRQLTDDDYANLLAFRAALRGFLRWSEEQAREAGVTPAQHQLLLVVRGHREPGGPTIQQAAAYLGIHHHSAVGLADRAATAGLVIRRPDPADARAVRLSLTELGERRIRELTALHLTELARLAPVLDHLTGG